MSTTITTEFQAPNAQLVRATGKALNLEQLQRSPHMLTVAPVGSGRQVFVRNMITLTRATGARLVLLSPDPFEPSLHEFASVVREGVANCVQELVHLALKLAQESEDFRPEAPTFVLIEDTRFLSDASAPELTEAARIAVRALLEQGAEKGIYIHAVQYPGAIDEELFGPSVAKSVLTRKFSGRPVSLPKSWDAAEYARLIERAPQTLVGHGVSDVGGSLQSFFFPYAERREWAQDMRAAGF